MGSFFEGVIGVKKNSGLFAYAIAKPTRNVLATPKRKFSYIFIYGLMANFQFRGCRIIFWRGHRCKKKFWAQKIWVVQVVHLHFALLMINFNKIRSVKDIFITLVALSILKVAKKGQKMPIWAYFEISTCNDVSVGLIPNFISLPK